jgi:Family of unknown function (DUF6281)
MTSRYGPVATLAVSALLVVGSVACGSSEETDSPSSSAGCAFVAIDYDGHTYRGTAAKVAPVAGEPLGRVAVPPCRDTPDAADEPADAIELAAIEGVPSDVAVMRRAEHSMIFVRDDVDFAVLPPALARLLRGQREPP